MSEPLDDDDDMTEIYDADIPRVDLVGKAANGAPRFLLAKSQGGLIAPDVVRALAKSDPTPAPRDDITMTGSPAAIAAMIHAAPVRKETPMTATVAKDDPMDAPVDVADIIPDAPSGSTAESLPGSPDWENLDAETAQNIIGILARVKGALGYLGDREATEAVTADPSDEENAWDMDDACCAIDSIIGTLAGYAAGEQIEAQMDEQMEAVGKAVADIDSSALDTLERLGPIRKAGRVLSAQNEQAIRGAVDSLQNVLASLPQAPPVDDSVAKEKKMTDTPATDVPVEKSAEERHADALALLAKAASEDGWTVKVEKAKGDPQMAVYDADGNLVGTIDQADLSPIAKPTPPEGGDSQSDDGDDQPPADANDGPAANQPPASQVPPATPTAPAVPTASPMQKSDIEELMKSILADSLKEAFGPLEERLAKVEAQPASGGPMLNGATPDQSLGQPVHRGETGTDPIGDLRKAIADEPNSHRKVELQMQLASLMVQAAPPLTANR